MGVRAAKRRRPLGDTPLRFALLVGLFIAGCASNPPSPAAMSPSATHPPVTSPPATTTPTPTPIATPRVTPTPVASFGSTPNIVQTIDATVVAPPVAPALYDVAFADVTTGWASGSGVILGTTDGGQSWQRDWSGSRSISSLVVVDRLHVVGLAYKNLVDILPTADRLIRTTDGGRTWTTTPVAGGFREIAFSSALTGWAVVGGIADSMSGPGRLEATVDGGRHWHAATLKARVDSVCFASSSVGWAASGSGVYRTLDGGRRWSRVARGPNDVISNGWQATVRCGGSAAWVFWNGGAAAGSEGYRVARTLDGGVHWKIVLSQLDDALQALPTIDAYAGPFAAVSATSATFLGWCPACGAGTWSSTRTTDGGRTVTHAPLGGLAGASLNDIAFPDATHGWIAGSAAGGFLLATVDGGRSWRRAYPSTALRPAVDVAFVSPNVGFGLGVVGDGRAILRTNDGGRTWRSIGRLPADPVEPQGEPILAFVDADHGWVAIVDGLLATRDGGRTWHRVPKAPPGGVAFADALHGCAGRYDTVAQTTDGGTSWAPVRATDGLVACAASLLEPAWALGAQGISPNNSSLSLGAIVDATHAWAMGLLDATPTRGLVVTSDGGGTWTAYRWSSPPDELDDFVRVSFVSPATGWVFTRFGHLFQTTDGGGTWREIVIR